METIIIMSLESEKQDILESQTKAQQIFKLKLCQYTNSEQFALKKFQQNHERFLCYIKFKLKYKIQDDYDIINVKGSGILIDKQYVLTVAHNVLPYKQALNKLQNNKKNPIDLSYVKQGLIGGDFLCKYKIIDVFISKKYMPHYDYNTNNKKLNQEQIKGNSYDYALIKVQAFKEFKNIKKLETYPLLLALEQKHGRQLNHIQVYGYPVDSNKQSYHKKLHLYQVKAKIKPIHNEEQNVYTKNQEEDDNYYKKSSIYMDQVYKMQGDQQQFKSFQIKYNLPTQKGISGGPIVTLYKQYHIVIGLHKGKKQEEKVRVLNNKKIKDSGLENEGNKQEFNLGICCGLMMDQLNEIGYKQLKRPFVYTERTLRLRQKINKVVEKQKLYKVDQHYTIRDIRVIISYDLNNVKRLYLSKNIIRTEGFRCLTQRQFPFIKSIYLGTNHIRDLSDIDEKNWKNIENVSTLSLSINQLKQLPDKLVILKNLQNLWLTFNPFQTIPQVLLNLSKLKPQKQRKIYFYYTKIFKYRHTKQQDLFNKCMIQELKGTKTTLLITKRPEDQCQLQ